MVRPVHNILAILMLGITVSLSATDTTVARYLQAAYADTAETPLSKNTIRITQNGSGNSATISQSGSMSNTTAVLHQSGKKNVAQISTGSDLLFTEISFSGSSNRLVIDPGPTVKLFSIENFMNGTTEPDEIFEYFFISNHSRKSIHVHQTSDGVRINPKKP